MSVLDDIVRFEEDLVERVRELEPLVREYDELRALVQQLGDSYTPGEPTAPANAPRRRARSASKGRSGRSGAKDRTGTAEAERSAGTAAKQAVPRRPAGVSMDRSPTRSTARRRRRADEEVMRIVGEEPGITVPGISDRLRVNRPDLYRLTNALAKDGRLRKSGPKLYLAEPPAAAAGTEAPATSASTRHPLDHPKMAGEPKRVQWSRDRDRPG